jgi:hypothetical protein
MRRDPSDIIKVGDSYYIWYTKLDSTAPGYPGGWAGTVWYASSPDGWIWEEQGQALAKGPSGAWDGYGAYTPNILPYKGKFYIAYTAQTDAEPDFKLRQAAIGMAVSDSPDGPWKRLDNNPVISPSSLLSKADGFLCDDAALIVRYNTIWFYYKGFPAQHNEQGRLMRYMKRQHHEEAPLHRGHEVAVWPEQDGSVGSFTLGCGPSLYYRSKDGIKFEPAHPMA